MGDARPSMQVLQLGMDWFPEEAGGLNRMYYELLRHLPECGVTTRGLVAGSPQVFYDSGQQVRAFALPTAPLPARWWGLRRELRRMLAEQRPDLVATHFALYAFPGLDLIRQYPLVVHFHGPWALEAQVEHEKAYYTKVAAALEWAVYRRGTHFVVLSDAFREILHRHYRVPMERIRVVPGGVDVNRFATELTREQAREQLGWPQDRPTVIVVRRLVRRMGLEDLIVATSEVRKRVPEVLLVLAGTGPLAGALWEQVESLGLKNNVQMVGFVPERDLPVAYRAADLSVVPTVAFEGFGLIAVESIAAGTPVLVTPVGGLPEVVRDLSSDLVLPATGAEPLAEGMAAALTGGSVLPGAEECQAFARARYAWPVIAAGVREVYSEALQ